MFKNVLVPVDLAHAEKSTALVDAAKKLVERGECALTLLNVTPEVPPYVAVELPEDLPDKIMSRAQTELTELARKHSFPATTKIKVVRGHPAQQILKIASDTEPDLILIASHQPGFADYLLGSVAAKVVRHAQCSVLVLR